ncbi:FIG027937: secreted protein [[Actinomadura] parvosata subsp. kistnae]|uniref:DUF3180 domain-containing protein n=1 Tax=[Actinomadura] parvosata subsp. kistnae TaxID=1909395 RepID=A0A1V0ACU6_9ACTN|nr:DUF3180 domain-containing protein [Nonomuraea sp. ATCC 55076]AQZ68017.1 hypothetical protein BKM31_47040 [Nonomuraea sp. ATCC 55076]SPL93610.1 FIG027937: secreted protein [Actinomadura parvosata subsp. kistnae]
MKPTRPGPLVGIVVVIALLTWAVVRQMYSELPLMPWTAIPTVLLLSIGEAYSGWATKARIARKPGTKPVEPLAVARLAALAKASAYAGAVFGGIFAGFALHTAQILDRETPRGEFFVATGSFVSCVVLVCAALYLEHACRIPKDPDATRD